MTSLASGSFILLGALISAYAGFLTSKASTEREARRDLLRWRRERYALAYDALFDFAVRERARALVEADDLNSPYAPSPVGEDEWYGLHARIEQHASPTVIEQLEVTLRLRVQFTTLLSPGSTRTRSLATCQEWTPGLLSSISRPST
jgi:hypothetical protein